MIFHINKFVIVTSSHSNFFFPGKIKSEWITGEKRVCLNILYMLHLQTCIILSHKIKCSFFKEQKWRFHPKVNQEKPNLNKIENRKRRRKFDFKRRN